MINLGGLWQKITATRYTRALEAEVVRLRAENRALLNSILGIAGVPPITVPDSALAENIAACVGTSSPTTQEASRARQTVTSAANGKMQGAGTVPPMRKRSWHQIYRMLELDSAKKKTQEVTETLSATTRG